MLGTIEELEKDIEQFQKNMATTGELQMLLRQMLEQIKQQNSDFNSQATALISRVDNLPSTIDNVNISSNNRVKNDVAAEIDRALHTFSTEQSRYLQGMEHTKQQLQSYIEQLQFQDKTFSDKMIAIVAKVDDMLSAIKAENTTSNAQVKADVAAELENSLQKFAVEQTKYLETIASMKQQIQSYVQQSNAQEKTFSDCVTSAIGKFDESVSKIIDENTKANTAQKAAVDKLLEERNTAFVAEQNKYILSLQQTQTDIKECDSKLTTKYSEFISTLENLNISNLYEQNVQLKNELNKRTTLLMIISAISIVVGIVGIVL